MTNSTALELIWAIEDVLPGWKYKVKLANMDFTVTWYKSWNMKRNNIAIMLWDYVKIEINEYDNTQWRINYRYKYPPQELLADANIDLSVTNSVEDLKHDEELIAESVKNDKYQSTRGPWAQKKPGGNRPTRKK